MLTRTTRTAALVAAALAFAPAAVSAQGLDLEVRPAGPPAWLDPPNVVSPSATDSWGTRAVEQQNLGTQPPFAGQDRFGKWMLPRSRGLGEPPAFIQFDD